MVWNTSEPQDTTKIRNLGNVIRPNWSAIEDPSDFSFQPDAFICTDRTPLGVANDPSPAVDGGVSRGNGYSLYCKQNGSGDQQLYGIDPAGAIIQFTNGASTLATQGKVFIPGGILIQWDRVSAASGSTVNFPETFGAAPYYVNFIPTGTSGTNRIFHRLNGNPVAASFSPIIVISSGSGITETIYYIAIGIPA